MAVRANPALKRDCRATRQNTGVAGRRVLACYPRMRMCVMLLSQVHLVVEELFEKLTVLLELSGNNHDSERALFSYDENVGWRGRLQ